MFLTFPQKLCQLQLEVRHGKTFWERKVIMRGKKAHKWHILAHLWHTMAHFGRILGHVLPHKYHQKPHFRHRKWERGRPARTLPQKLSPCKGGSTRRGRGCLPVIPVKECHFEADWDYNAARNIATLDISNKIKLQCGSRKSTDRSLEIW